MQPEHYEARLREHIHEKHESLWFTKLEDWADEDEFRLVLWTATDSNDDVFISIRGALRGIILGCDCSGQYDIRAHDYGRQLNIPVHRIHWMNYSIHLQ